MIGILRLTKVFQVFCLTVFILSDVNAALKMK